MKSISKSKLAAMTRMALVYNKQTVEAVLPTAISSPCSTLKWQWITSVPDDHIREKY